jgi:hypothetical protein
MQSRSPLIKAIFETISHFSNLHSLYCTFTAYRAELPALRVENLQHLHKLHIHGGPLSCPNEPTSFKISTNHFGYTGIFLPHALLPDGPPHSSCLSLLNPETLRSLELGAGHSLGLEHLLEDTDTMASFHSLHTLSISFAHTDFPRIHAAIAPFPAIEDLIVSLKQSCEEDIYAVPDTPLAPHLCRYKGPAALLPLVLRGSQPSHLSVARGSAAELLSTLLRTIYDPKSITSLAIRVTLHADVCEGTVLLELLALFPHLTRLAVHVSSDDASAVEPSEPHTTSVRRRSSFTSHFLILTKSLAVQHVCERLANILTVPPVLRSVVFRWRLSRSQDAEIVPDVSQLAARVRPVNPDLEVAFSRLSADLWGF